MRVLIVTSWPRYGGEGKVAFGLSMGLKANSWDSHLWTNRSIPKLIRGIIYTPYGPLDKVRKGLGEVYAIIAKILFLPLLLFRETLASYGIITFTPEDLLPTVLVAKLFKRKIVYVIHGPSYIDIMREEFASNIGSRFIYYIVKSLNKYVNAYVTVSRLEKKELQKLGIEKKVVTIHNGIDAHEFEEITKGDIRGSPSLLFVGRLEKIKGIDSLLEAFKKIRQKLPNATLYICGEGTYEKRIEEELEKTDINYLGFVSGMDLIKLFVSVNLVIIPSIYDAFNLVVLEGLAAGKPVIVSERVGSAELIDNGIDGFVITPNSNEIAKVVIEIWNNKNLLNKVAKNAKVKVRSFSWDKVARKYIQVLTC